jgi:hypothetical protein
MGPDDGMLYGWRLFEDTHCLASLDDPTNTGKQENPGKLD